MTHDHENCGGGCGGCGKHNHTQDGFDLVGFDNEDLESAPILTLTLEDDTELECSILGNLTVEGIEYIALLPMGDDEVLIYRFKEEENGEVDLGNIESDEEYEKVAEVFNQQFALDDLDDEDDEE